MQAIQQGIQAEQYAEKYLIQHGLVLIERNFRLKIGEIDLIMQDKDYLVFVEVRYRKNNHFGGAVASIDARKRKKIVNTAKYYLAWHQKYDKIPCRFDVVAIEGTQTTWIKNAFGE